MFFLHVPARIRFANYPEYNSIKCLEVSSKRYMMGNYGYFDDANREYVVTDPKTPLPWINYLGSKDFFRLISNTGGGYCFYKDAKLLRLTRYRYNNSPADSGGHYYYIKDGDTIWNPGWQPVQTPLDEYSCRHGLGYTVISGSKNGISARQEIFVPVDDPCEVTRISLTNHSETEKKLDLYSYVEFCLWNAMDDMSNFQRNLSIGEVEAAGSRIYHKTEYRERRNHYAVFAVNREIAGFDTSRDAFIVRRSSSPRRMMPVYGTPWAIASIRVDLPAPFGPASISHSPSRR